MLLLHCSDEGFVWKRKFFTFKNTIDSWTSDRRSCQDFRCRRKFSFCTKRIIDFQGLNFFEQCILHARRAIKPPVDRCLPWSCLRLLDQKKKRCRSAFCLDLGANQVHCSTHFLVQRPIPHLRFSECWNSISTIFYNRKEASIAFWFLIPNFP